MVHVAVLDLDGMGLNGLIAVIFLYGRSHLEKQLIPTPMRGMPCLHQEDTTECSKWNSH